MASPSPKLSWVCCPLLSFGLQTAFRVICKKLPWVPNFTCLRRNVSILFSASTSTPFRVSTVHLHLDLSSIFGPLFSTVSLLSFLLSELSSLSPTLCTPFCNTRHSLMSRRFYSPYKPLDNRCNYLSLQGENNVLRERSVFSRVRLFVCM